MLSVENLYLRFGEKPLFDEISLRVNAGQRVALAGRNGQGKSTLMKVIAGEQAAERGKVDLSKGAKVGYLPQDIKPPDNDRTALEEALSGFGDVVKLEEEIRHLSEQVAAHPEDEALLTKLGRAQATFESQGGYAAEARTREVLAGLGFEERQVSGPLRNLSGGWLMRTQLARLLLMKPDVLLLDEPTNHLDLESKEWLLGFLQGYPGALLLTSHDRWFLDALVDKVLEVEGGKLEVYAGNYSKYEVDKKERLERLKAAHARQQRWFEQQNQFVESNRAKAATASNAKSRIKQLEKVERIELPPEPPAMRLRFPEPPPAGHVVIRAHGLGKRYGAHRVFSGLDLELEAGTRLAVVGVNGAGKSTLLKLMAGKDKDGPSEGTLALGHNVVLQSFSQYEDDLPDPSWTLLQALTAVAPKDMGQGQLRTILGCFLFSGDDVEKRIGVLSGGERARLKLARMLMKPSNLLVLDEPTNHLDLHSKDLLLHALQHFSGTSVFVSHDRAFLAALATQVLEVKDGRGVLFPGGYEQYRWRQAQEAKAASQAAADADARAKAARAAAAADAKAAAPPKAGGGNALKEKQRAQKKVEQLEGRIATEEAALAALEAAMAEPGYFDDRDRAHQSARDHAALKEKIAGLWSDLEAALEAAE